MNIESLQEWLKLTDQTKRNIFAETGYGMGLPAAAIEKDWWIVKSLELVFNSSIAEHAVFKGGTSLSKAWNLIDRFSEDIDLALDRKFLGFVNEDHQMTSSQVSKLRRSSVKFIKEKYFPEIKELFRASGLRVEILLTPIASPDQDPIIIEIHYNALADHVPYLMPRVLLEIGSRSLIEPSTARRFKSFVGEHFAGRTFADHDILIPTVNPERTFLEKIFLLHETFQAPMEKIKVERKSRHLYDVERLMDTEHANRALNDTVLYHTIVEHRKTLTPLRGIDYSNHTPDKINPIPPDEILEAWEKDYKTMQGNMLYKPSLPFDKLIVRLAELKARINTLNH